MNRLQVLAVDGDAVALHPVEHLRVGHLRLEEDVAHRGEVHRVERVRLRRLELVFQLLVDLQRAVGVVRRVLDEQRKVLLLALEERGGDSAVRLLAETEGVLEAGPLPSEDVLGHALQVVRRLLVQKRVHHRDVRALPRQRLTVVVEDVHVVLRVREHPALLLLSEDFPEVRDRRRGHAHPALAPREGPEQGHVLHDVQAGGLRVDRDHVLVERLTDDGAEVELPRSRRCQVLGVRAGGGRAVPLCRW